MATTPKPIETIIVSYEEFNDLDFYAPSNYYILNSLGEYIFYKTRSRIKAQQQTDSEFGPHKYKVRSINLK